MKRLSKTLAAAALATLALAAPASAEFGIKDPDVTFTGPDGTPAMGAGSHPFEMTTSFEANSKVVAGGRVPDEEFKDVIVDLPPGFIGSAAPVPYCAAAVFYFSASDDEGRCPDATAIGVAELALGEDPAAPEIEDFLSEPDLVVQSEPVFLLEPPPGAAARLGFEVVSVPITVDVGLNPDSPHNVQASATTILQAKLLFGSRVRIWGVPSDPAHDPERGRCLRSFEVTGEGCSTSVTPEAFLTMPRRCTGPLATRLEADSWQNPGAWVQETVFSHDDSDPPNPLGTHGCSKLGFSPSITAQPTSRAAQSPSGLDFSLDVVDEGLLNPSGLANADIKKAVVTLPEGFTANPSIAEGLEVCTQAQLAKETAFSPPGAGCPNASKIGSVEVESQLIEENVNGALYIAEPYTNQFGTLLALYIVIKNPKLGIVVRQPVKVVPDPLTGQLTSYAEDLPELPFSHFRLHFREGARSPLATPSACGTYEVKAELTPSSGGAPITSTSAFEIITGPNAGPCPTAGLPPFRPGLLAGTLNNRAGAYSPFNLRLSRTDGEQEFTRFSIKLPPGLTGKLAGIPFCPDASIEAAKSRTGTEEEQSPSCPVASEIGHSLAGAGVGPSPAYAPGKVYLAGPYNGSALSLAAITAAKVGPFDLGTVVIREAFKIDRRTAEVFVDATGSDPIPHIIDGIQVHARDIRAYVDRPSFVLNPTSCERTSTVSTVLGSGLNFATEADDNPVVVSTPFQAADCAALPFNPKLKFNLIGGTKRGAHPKLRAALQMNGVGEAAISRARVTLSRSAFLDQGHIRTVCTRVQYAANQCPQASVYGYAKAITPLLEEPVEGPVYLRSSENKLPDLVAALRNGKIEVDLVGRIDSLKGRIRSSFDIVPDAPVDSFVLTMQGGAKGLIINSSNLCKGKPRRAVAEFTAHNGKAKDFRPVVKARCGGKGSKRGKRSAR